jgi:hypothetical protein
MLNIETVIIPVKEPKNKGPSKFFLTQSERSPSKKRIGRNLQDD